METTIAITAATGKVGTAVLEAARGRKRVVRALVRDATRLRASTSAAVPFDFDDRSTHARALEGVDTLILISPPSPRQIETESGVVDAARAAGVSHIVRLSGAGAEAGGDRFAEQHRALERHLQSSAVSATIVRAVFFMENMLGIAAPIASGMYPAPTGGSRLGQVAVTDIASVLFAVASAPDAHRGATYTLTGPAAHTGGEIAAAFSAAAGHLVRYIDVPETAFRQSLLDAGLDAWTTEGLIESYRFVRAGGTAATTDDVRRITGSGPVDFPTWARTHADAFRTRLTDHQKGAHHV